MIIFVRVDDSGSPAPSPISFFRAGRDIEGGRRPLRTDHTTPANPIVTIAAVEISGVGAATEEGPILARYKGCGSPRNSGAKAARPIASGVPDSSRLERSRPDSTSVGSKQTEQNSAASAVSRSTQPTCLQRASPGCDEPRTARRTCEPSAGGAGTNETAGTRGFADLAERRGPPGCQAAQAAATPNAAASAKAELRTNLGMSLASSCITL